MASVDDIATNTAFAQKNGATFPVLSDPSKTTASAYGVLSRAGYAARVTFYINPDGRILLIDDDVGTLTAGEEMISNFIQLGLDRRTETD